MWKHLHVQEIRLLGTVLIRRRTWVWGIISPTIRRKYPKFSPCLLELSFWMGGTTSSWASASVTARDKPNALCSKSGTPDRRFPKPFGFMSHIQYICWRTHIILGRWLVVYVIQEDQSDLWLFNISCVSLPRGYWIECLYCHYACSTMTLKVSGRAKPPSRVGAMHCDV